MTVEDLHKYKNDLTVGLNRNLSEFEKNFFFVSAGILTFSITFIKDIVKVQGSTFAFFLFLAWGLITLSVGLIMYAFLASANKSWHIWTCVDNFITTNELFTPATVLKDEQAKQIKSETIEILNSSKKWLKNIRFGAAGTFILGMFSFAFFIGVNLIKEKHKPIPHDDLKSSLIILAVPKDSLSIKFIDTISFIK